MKPDFLVVCERLKAALDLKTDAELGRRLAMSPSTFGNRKRAGSIPYDGVVELATEEGINLHWVFTGLGPRYAQGFEPSDGGQAVHEIHAGIFEDVIRAVMRPDLDGSIHGEAIAGSMEKLSPGTREAIEAFMQAARHSFLEEALARMLYAAGLYNQIANVKGESNRRSALEHEAEMYFAATSAHRRAEAESRRRTESEGPARPPSGDAQSHRSGSESTDTRRRRGARATKNRDAHD